ncbi:MAG: acyltransferase [Planctomycetota bacterium]|nr:acyltransferase [Planctomycetota bacterium]
MNRKQSKFLALEGLRGVASVIVLIVHLKNAFFPDLIEQVETRFGHHNSILLSGLLDGNFCVWLFWVMSAFVLSVRYHSTSNENEAQRSVTSATIRRYPRLALPVLASVLIAWLLVSADWMTNHELAASLNQQKGSWLDSFYGFPPSFFNAMKCGIWDSFLEYEPKTSYNRNLWTMEIEFFGSLLIFAFLALIGKHPVRLICYPIAFVVLNRLQLNEGNAFLVGIVLSDLYSSREIIAGRIGLKLSQSLEHYLGSQWILFLSMVPMIYLIGLPNYFGLLHLVLAASITYYLLFETFLSRVLSGRLFVFLGAISFGVYLAHIPLICSLGYPLYNLGLTLGTDTTARCFASLGLFLSSIAYGVFLWYFVDRHSVRFARWLETKTNALGWRVWSNPQS